MLGFFAKLSFSFSINFSFKLFLLLKSFSIFVVINCSTVNLSKFFSKKVRYLSYFFSLINFVFKAAILIPLMKSLLKSKYGFIKTIKISIEIFSDILEPNEEICSLVSCTLILLEFLFLTDINFSCKIFKQYSSFSSFNLIFLKLLSLIKSNFVCNKFSIKLLVKKLKSKIFICSIVKYGIKLIIFCSNCSE